MWLRDGRCSRDYERGMSLTLSVPATTANLGPGYDVLGMALSVRNAFRFEEADTFQAGGIPVSPTEHLALATAVRAASHFGGQLPPLAISWREAVPRSRGMGSSATVRVAGLAAALHFTGIEIPLRDQLTFLSREEGHPDNVVPARVGGLTLSASVEGEIVHRRFDPPQLSVALCIPDHEVETAAARAILPETVPHHDAVFTVSRIAFLIAGLVSGDADAVSRGLADRLHQPYRKTLIGPVDAVFDAAVRAGALGAFISGSGSTLAALVGEGDPAAVAKAMAGVFQGEGIPCRAQVVTPAMDGLRILADLDQADLGRP